MQKINLYLKEITHDQLARNDIFPSFTKNWYTVKQTEVQELEFDHVKLHFIKTDAFNAIQFQNMIVLTIRSAISYLFDGAFNGLSNLKQLVLIKTYIKNFLPNILVPLQSLELFIMECINDDENLSSMFIDNLFGSADMSKINHISIFNCNLNRTITQSTFKALINITDLTLESNQIRQIGQRSFDTIFPILKHLSLAMNELKTLPEGIFNMANTATGIELAQNPWHCDCKLDHLRTFLRFSQDASSESIFCSTPNEYTGLKLIDLQSLCVDNNHSVKFQTEIESSAENEHSAVTSTEEKDENLVFAEKEHNAQQVHEHKVNRTTDNTNSSSSLVPMIVIMHVPKNASNSAVTQYHFAGQFKYLLVFPLCVSFLGCQWLSRFDISHN